MLTVGDDEWEFGEHTIIIFDIEGHDKARAFYCDEE